MYWPPFPLLFFLPSVWQVKYLPRLASRGFNSDDTKKVWFQFRRHQKSVVFFTHSYSMVICQERGGAVCSQPLHEDLQAGQLIISFAIQMFSAINVNQNPAKVLVLLLKHTASSVPRILGWSFVLNATPTMYCKNNFKIEASFKFFADRQCLSKPSSFSPI